MGTYKHPGGRPSKFKKRYIQDLVDFFDAEPMRKEIMKETTKNGGEVSKEYKYVPNYFPTLVRFAKSIDVDYWTCWNWATNGDKLLSGKDMGHLTPKKVEELGYMAEFSKAYKHAKAQQEDFLIQNGLAGSSPSAAFIFTAKNVTSMRDKVEQDVRVTEVKPLLDNLRKNGIPNNHQHGQSSGPDETN